MITLEKFVKELNVSEISEITAKGVIGGPFEVLEGAEKRLGRGVSNNPAEAYWTFTTSAGGGWTFTTDITPNT